METIYKIKAVDGGGYAAQDFETSTGAEAYIFNFIPRKFWHKVKVVPKTKGETENGRNQEPVKT